MCFSSVNIKDPDTNQLSLAHFYRACSIWPSLSIHDVLVPSTRPLVSTAAITLSQGGLRRKLKLSARVPRLSYLSGQSCHVHVQILNDTYKTVRSMRLTLIRTTTVYRPQLGKRNGRDQSDNTTTSYQTKTFVDAIAESQLAMAERTTRKCASSRGWWAGVGPQERTGFTHSILIPVCPYPSINCRQIGSVRVVTTLSLMRCQSRAPNSLPSTMKSVLRFTPLRVHWDRRRICPSRCPSAFCPCYPWTLRLPWAVL